MRSTRPITIPAAGVIRGGKLNGWRFHFVCFRLEGMALEIVARCTPPAWPFFREMWINHTFFGTIRPVIGERAKLLDAVPLIATTYKAAGLQPPEWLINSDLTLRARLKRTHGSNARGA